MTKNISCVVLGANGFIGTNLVQKLIQAGSKVTGFARQDSNIFLKDIEWVKGDFSNQDAIRNAIKGKEIVYHLIDNAIPAAITKANQLLTNISDTINLLDICVKEDVRKIIYISSGGTVYGITNNQPINEKISTNPICSYGINKLASEKYIHLYHHLHKLDYAIVRLSNPFGPHQNTLKPQGIIATLIANFLMNKTTKIWGDGEIIRDYIYVDDVVDGLIQLIDHSGSTKIFNLGSGIGRSINQIIFDLEKIIGQRKINVDYINSTRPIDVPVNILDTRLIQKHINWNIKIDWYDALKLTIDWMKNHKS